MDGEYRCGKISFCVLKLLQDLLRYIIHANTEMLYLKVEKRQYNMLGAFRRQVVILVS